jgi:hypothetical protein
VTARPGERVLSWGGYRFASGLPRRVGRTVHIVASRRYGRLATTWCGLPDLELWLRESDPRLEGRPAMSPCPRCERREHETPARWLSELEPLTARGR